MPQPTPRRPPIPREGPVADRARELIRTHAGRHKIWQTLCAEGHDVTVDQVRSLLEHVREEQREDRTRVRDEVVSNAVEKLAPAIPDDLDALREVRDTMLQAMRSAVTGKEPDFEAASSCAGRVVAAARARLEIAGATPVDPAGNTDEIREMFKKHFGFHDAGTPAAVMPNAPAEPNAGPGPVAP
jgi:hypothetical protein